MIIQHLTPCQQDVFLIENETDNKLKNISEQDFKNLTVEKPWGKEYLLFENNDAAIWILQLESNKTTSFHAHPNKTTSLIVLGGQACCKTLTKTYELRQLEAIILGKKVFHQTANISSEQLFLMEIESPVNKFDLVRYEDIYGRQDQAYESKKSFKLTPDSYMNKGTMNIGNTKVCINYAIDFFSFIKQISREKNSIITILDRHVWSNNGVKLIEVGKSFKIEDIEEDFMINDHFHYMVIHKI